ncbi:hypothetical protein MASR2M78_37150 [Treponema sp.]
MNSTKYSRSLLTSTTRHASCTKLALLFLCLLLGACKGLSYDPSLYTDDLWIAKEGDTYSYLRRSTTHTGTELVLTFNGFYGKHTVWMIESEGNTVLKSDIEIAPTLRGQYKVCLVNPEKQVTVLAAGAGKLQGEVPLKAGKQYIVLVGLEASGAINVGLSLATDAGRGAAGVSIKSIY